MSGWNIDYKNDWAGECRNDPEDGNTYVLRTLDIHTSGEFQDLIMVGINDILGGHHRIMPVSEWLRWERT